MTVNLVIVSHSAALGNGVYELAQQMLHDTRCQIAVAAGMDDPPGAIGTDPVKVMTAIESVAGAAHVVVMMDMGSALLSAEMALELLDPAIAAKVTLCAAPLVEGTLAAVVAAAGGAGVSQVIAEAENALQAKRVQLGMPETLSSDVAPPAPVDAEACVTHWTVRNPNGLHVRPAAKLVAALAEFDAQLRLENAGKCVVPDSLNQIALLQVRCGDEIRLFASGPQAQAALDAFDALARRDFDEPLAPVAAARPAGDGPVSCSGAAWFLPATLPAPDFAATGSAGEEHQRLKQAIEHTVQDLKALASEAQRQCGQGVADIFSGHALLLDDPELFQSACTQMAAQGCGAAFAWHQVLQEVAAQYQALDNAYLQARYIDILDILARSLHHLLYQSAPVLPAPTSPGPVVLVAEDIYPSQVLALDGRQVQGVCLRAGSALSHSAIIARHRGLPLLAALGPQLAAVPPGGTITLDLQTQQIRVQ